MEFVLPENHVSGYHMLCRYPSTRYSLHFVWLNGNSLWISKVKAGIGNLDTSMVSTDSKVWNDHFLLIKISALSGIHTFEELVPTDCSEAYHYGVAGAGKLGSNYSEVSWSLAFRTNDECGRWRLALQEAENYLERQRANGSDKRLCGLVKRMMKEVPTADRYHHFNKFSNCFLGDEAVAWIRKAQSCSEEQALSIGHQLVNLDLIHHCLHEHSLCNAGYFYRFNSDMIMSVSGTRVETLHHVLSSSASSAASRKDELVLGYLIDSMEQMQGELSVEQVKAKCLSRMNRNLEASIKSLSTDAAAAIKRSKSTEKFLVHVVAVLITVFIGLALLILSAVLTANTSSPTLRNTTMALLASSGAAVAVYGHVLSATFRYVSALDHAVYPAGDTLVIPAASDGSRPSRTLSEAVLYEDADAIWAVSSVHNAEPYSPLASPLLSSGRKHETVNESSGQDDSFRREVEDENSSGPEGTARIDEDVVPERYIRGCGGEIEEAKRRWDLTLQWRRENAVDSILSEPQPHFHTIKECYPHFFHGRSNGKVSSAGGEDRSYCVYYEKLGELNLPKLKQKEVYVKHILRHFVFLTEYIYTYLEPDNQHGKTITVLDVSGVGLSDLVGDALEFLKENTKVTQDHYVERCQKIFVVNASYMFTFLWRMVQPLVNENTRQKISILGGDMTELRDYIGASQLPEEYGGPAGAVLGSSEEEKALRLFVDRLNYVSR